MIPPGGTIGILGGGQLGRMLAMAAARLGYRCHVYAPDKDSVAAEVSAKFTCADWHDKAALADFAGDCAVVHFVRTVAHADHLHPHEREPEAEIVAQAGRAVRLAAGVLPPVVSAVRLPLALACAAAVAPLLFALSRLMTPSPRTELA